MIVGHKQVDLFARHLICEDPIDGSSDSSRAGGSISMSVWKFDKRSVGQSCSSKRRIPKFRLSLGSRNRLKLRLEKGLVLCHRERMM